MWRKWKRRLNNLHERNEFVKKELRKVKVGSRILDAGCGSQQYRKYCDHLIYSGQDFGQYEKDDKLMIGAEDTKGNNITGGVNGYAYGKLDYVGDIWSISENDNYFDAILCTEVFEHIPFPNETITEFARLLRSGGKLILTAPSNCLRHMDPYFFYGGFSDRWFEKILTKNGFEILSIKPIGDYYSWLGVEMARSAMSSNILVKIILFPAFLYFFTRKKTQISIDTLCMGYHVVAKKNHSDDSSSS